MNGHEQFFLANLIDWTGAATAQDLGPQISQKENSARQSCKRKGWVVFQHPYWRITPAGRQALKDEFADHMAEVDAVSGKAKENEMNVEMVSLAEVIHKARWPDDRQMDITPFADEDRNGREYCFRIARAVRAYIDERQRETT